LNPRKRRLLLLALPTTALALAAAAWLLWPRTAITRDNAARVQPGMALGEIEALLGGARRDEATGPLAIDQPGPAVNPFARFDRPVKPLTRRMFWVSDQVVIAVTIDDRDAVQEVVDVPVRRMPVGPLDLLHHWLGL
jgi:hypothetical protein